MGARRLALVWAVAALTAAAACSQAAAAPGERDPTFATGGIFEHEFTPSQFGSSSVFHLVRLAPGGDIVAAGFARREGGGSWLALVARLSENGALDPSFATGGAFVGIYQEFNPTTLYQDSIEGAVIEPDGGIVTVFGRLGGRLTSSGQVDGSFRNSAPYLELKTLAQAAGGALVVGGWNQPPESDTVRIPAVQRWLSNGAPDTTFGNHGEVQIPLSLHSAEVTALLPLAEGRLLVAGTGWNTSSTNGSEETGWLVRLNSNGSLDGTFGSGGVVTLPATQQHVALAQQPSGRILFAGDSPTATPGPGGQPHGLQSVIWGLTQQGHVDPSFGQSGAAPIPSAEADNTNLVEGLAVDAAGRPYLVSSQTLPTNYPTSSFVARLTASGQLDAAYGHGGLSLGPEKTFLTSVAVDAQGRAIVSGYGEHFALLERLQGDAPAAVAPGGATPPAGNHGAPGRAKPRVRVRLACRVRRAPRRHASRLRHLACTLTIAQLPGRWSSLEATLQQGHRRLARARIRRLRLPAVVHLSLVVGRSTPTYGLTLIARHGRSTERITLHVRIASLVR